MRFPIRLACVALLLNGAVMLPSSDINCFRVSAYAMERSSDLNGKAGWNDDQLNSYGKKASQSLWTMQKANEEHEIYIKSKTGQSDSLTTELAEPPSYKGNQSDYGLLVKAYFEKERIPFKDIGLVLAGLTDPSRFYNPSSTVIQGLSSEGFELAETLISGIKNSGKTKQYEVTETQAAFNIYATIQSTRLGLRSLRTSSPDNFGKLSSDWTLAPMQLSNLSNYAKVGTLNRLYDIANSPDKKLGTNESTYLKNTYNRLLPAMKALSKVLK